MNIKQEKGSMAVYVTIVLVSMVFILTAVFLMWNSARKNQLKTAMKVKETYEADNIRADIIYDKLTNKPFNPKPTPEPPSGGTVMEDMTNGIIEIKWLEGTTNKVVDTPNAPVIKTDLPEGTTMEQVVFDEAGKTWVPGTEYSYVAGIGSKDNNSSKWANARVTINGVESYFVWIPRYAYRIIYFNSADSKIAYQEGKISEEEAVANGQIIGYSDSRGIVDAQGRKIGSVVSTTKTMVSEDYFMVHPAFINDVDAGGWTEELEGIWVGKYETSGTTSQLKVQPGVSSLRAVTIGDMYTYSQNYANNLQSHMLKNSEWGAVAYLTESAYGRNGTEVTMNNSSGYITGSAKTTSGTTNDYTSTEGVLASSTGNVYGIYDLSGGAFEYIAGYYNGSNVNSTRLEFGSSFASIGGMSDEYSISYNGSAVKTEYKYGDATMETKSWHSDGTYFVGSDYPFFRYGGYFGNASAGAGVFYCGHDTGGKSLNNSFRLALVV